MKAAVLALLLFAFPAHAEKGGAVEVYFENDSHTLGGPGSDNNYSNGFKVSYVSADNHVPGWAQPVLNLSPAVADRLKAAETNFSLSLAQQIYTPNNTGNPDPIPDDRPYAAWTYLAFAAHFKTDRSSHVLELDIGLIGPSAGGETIQNGFHRIIGIDLVQGWRYQLHDEATLQLSYQERLKFFELRNDTYKNWFDVIPYFGASLGNVLVNAHIGGMVRLGSHLPDNFGPTRASSPEGDTFVEPQAGRDSSLYVFAGVRGEAVARNIFLDGNTDGNSPRVHKFPFVFESQFGVGALWQRWSATWQFVTRSPEFQERSKVNSFASISLSYGF